MKRPCEMHGRCTAHRLLYHVFVPYTLYPLYLVYPIPCTPCTLYTLYSVYPIPCIPYTLHTLYAAYPIPCKPPSCIFTLRVRTQIAPGPEASLVHRTGSAPSPRSTPGMDHFCGGRSPCRLAQKDSDLHGRALRDTHSRDRLAPRPEPPWVSWPLSRRW